MGYFALLLQSMKISLLLTALFYLQISFAQTNKAPTPFGLIIGNIIDAKDGKGVAFATIQLRKLPDTNSIKTTTADKDGAFELEKLSFGYYRIIVLAVGYTKITIDSIHLRSERFDFNIGDVKLNNNSFLDEVVVYAEKPLIENKDGKITYNVGESALSGGASTAELLKNMPLVSNDPNGRILLKGKEPKILIDDKPTELTATQLQDLLESLPGNSIEKIELMTNPPPQFATEAGGVINIVTKKGKVGWIGRVNANIGSRGEANLGANISYIENKYSINLSLGIGVSQVFGNSYSRRENHYADSSNQFNTDGNFKNKNLRPNLRLQYDYEIDKFKSYNITYQGNLNYFNNYSQTQFTNINRLNQIYRLSTRENESNGNGYSHGLTFSYTIKTKKPAEVLRLIATSNLGKNENDRDFFQQFLNPLAQSTGLDSSQNQFFNNYNYALSVRVNYDRPIHKKGHMLSTGMVWQWNNYHNTLNTSFLRKQDGVFLPNDLLSNDFRFLQEIYTARIGFTFILPDKWRIVTGVQAENTNFKFTFLKGNSANTKNNYWNLLPNLTLRKEFTKEFNTSVIYRATIRRPGIGELNPNIDYGDPYNIRFGNPFLLPTLSDNFDWNLSYIKGKYNINTSIGYNKLKDVFNTIRTLIEAGKTQVTWLNIANRQEYEASFWGGYTFSKKFRINSSIGYTYNQYGEAEKKLYRYRDGGTFYTTVNYSYTPSNVLTFEGNARYSKFADPQGVGRSNLTMNIGVQHKFFDRRLIISFNMIDPFVTQQFRNFTYGTNFTLESFSNTNTRNFRLSVSWQINKQVKKSAISEKQKKDALNKIKQPV